MTPRQIKASFVIRIRSATSVSRGHDRRELSFALPRSQLRRGAWRAFRLCFNYLCQTFDCRNDRLSRVATETKHKGRSRCCCNMQAAHRPDDDAVLAPCALDRDVRETPPRVCNEMHP